MKFEELKQEIQGCGWARLSRILSCVQWQKLAAEEVKSLLPIVFEKFIPIREYDRPMYMGRALALASHDEQDAVALAWLAESPTEVRLQIVSNFLFGLWKPAVRRKPIGLAEVEELIRIREHLLLETAIDPGVGLNAFFDTIRGDALSPEGKKRMADVLREVQKSPSTSEELSARIQDILGEQQLSA